MARISDVSSVKVLVVDDDEALRRGLAEALGLEGFVVRAVDTGEAALTDVIAYPPEIVVLDVGLPGMSGVDTVRTLRRDGWSIPVCMLSARDEVTDRVAGLAAGADDYVVKPFSVGELSARLRALVTLHRVRYGGPLDVGELHVDFSRHVATRGGRDLGLTTREFDLLVAFLRHPHQVLSRNQLLEYVWGYTWDVESNVVDVFVGYVRRKLESAGEPRILHTARGMGFVMRP